MTREQKCIIELWQLVDTITDSAEKGDLSFLRKIRGAQGCDMYMGCPPISRVRDDIADRYADIIRESFKAEEILMYEERKKQTKGGVDK